MMKIFPLLALAALGGSAYAPSLPGGLWLMPWPKDISVQPGSVAITGSFTVSVSGAGAGDSRVQKAVPRFVHRLAHQTGIPMPAAAPVGGDATLNITVANADHAGPQKLGDNEQYSLTVTDNHVSLAAEYPLGVLRGMETLLQMVRQTSPPAEATFCFPNVTIRDEPRFPWRGLSFDVSRHFMPVDVVKRELDGLAAVKMNVFHWHLSDDEGFRVESKKFPKLQELGSDGMFYTQEQIRDIIAYAGDRGIRVIPEFDMPGHSTSWLVAYPELGAGDRDYHIIHEHVNEPTSVMDPTKESTYEFLDTFIGEMADLFPDEYFHVGGDEVSPKKWIGSPHIKAFMDEHKMANAAALQSYFSKRLLEIVTKHGKRMVGWDEILNPDLPKTAVVQSWRGQESLWSSAKDGYQGMLSAGYYLDLSYSAAYHYSIDPLKWPATPRGKPLRNGAPEPGTPAGLTAEQAKLVLGGEAAMWEELANTEIVDSRLWPRLAVIAERFWSPENTTDLASMYRREKATSEWLEWLGLRHRTDLELMRRRLAGPYPQWPLETMASIIEPTKGYSRHAERYGIFSQLNKLPFAIQSESDTAREFNDEVDRYLAAEKATRNGKNLTMEMEHWAGAMKALRPMLENQTLLKEHLPVAEGIENLCNAGQEAITYIDGSAKVPAGWKQKALAEIEPYVGKPQGFLLIQIAPGVQQLVEAVK